VGSAESNVFSSIKPLICRIIYGNNRYSKKSRQLVNRFGVIVFEDLDIQNMLKNHHLAKSISDVAWGMLVKATESKAAYSGSKVVLFDPKYTSQMCSRCGMIAINHESRRLFAYDITEEWITGKSIYLCTGNRASTVSCPG